MAQIECEGRPDNTFVLIVHNTLPAPARARRYQTVALVPHRPARRVRKSRQRTAATSIEIDYSSTPRRHL